MHKLFSVVLLVVYTMVGIANSTNNSPESDTLVASPVEVDSVIILPDDQVLQAMDKMLEDLYFQSFAITYDSSKLTSLLDSIPQVSDSVFQQRLALLDAATPFSLDYNNHVKAFLKLYANRRRTLTSRLLGLSEMYFPMFEEVLAKHELPLEFKYLAIVESALNPKARSRAGAVGLWQFMYSTGKIYHLNANSYFDDRMDPYLATEAACEYFKFLYGLYGNYELVMAAYNCGPGNVNKAIRRSGGKRDYWSLWPYLPKETRGYVPAFIAVNYIMNYATEHNIYAQKPKMHFFECDTVHVNEEVSFSQISECLALDMEQLRFLNPRYSRDFIPYTGTPNTLCLPRDMIGEFITNEEAIYVYNELSKEEQERAEKERIALQEAMTIHKVRSGEYLGLIAGKYGVGVSEIKKWNNLRSNNLKIGQRLVIYTHKNPIVKPSTKPATVSSSATYYTIKTGDTLWDIAKAKGVGVNDLKRYNSHLNFNRLKPGMKIVIHPGK